MPANNLQELVALARAKPGTLNYGSYGSGSQPHLAAETLKSKAGIDIVHIPYKGIPFAVPAAIAGEVQLTFSGIASSQAHVKAGRLKALAIGGGARSPLMPEVPTFAEQGYPEVETHAWFGLFVPAGSPRVGVDRIQRDVAAVLTTRRSATARSSARATSSSRARPTSSRSTSCAIARRAGGR